MVLRGSGTRMSATRCHPVAACGGLKTVGNPCGSRLDPPNIKGFRFWRPGAWMSGFWKDWNGLEEVTEATEGIGMGGGDWKKFSHAGASGARRICLRI